MTANFYVYLNIPNNKTLIHHAECSHCNHGEGADCDEVRWSSFR